MKPRFDTPRNCILAIGRLSVKVGKKGKAAAHSNYIERQGKYAHRLKTGERLVSTESGNMPSWATSSSDFWKAADNYERANGTTYREMEIALPRELNDKQNEQLVREWVQQEIGNKHSYTWAIHSPKSSDGGEQPHVHLMFSERELDGYERGPEQFFKRYNSKTPEKGGAKKNNTGKHPVERREELKKLRTRWQFMCNRHLRAADCKERISLKRNNELREGVPEPKMLPSEWKRGTGKADILAFREARQELVDAKKTVRIHVQPTPQKEANLIYLTHQQKRAQEKAQRDAEARKKAEEQRRTQEELLSLETSLPKLERELEQETARRVERDFEYRALLQDRERHELARKEAEANADKAAQDETDAAQEAKDLEQKHKIQARLHRSGFKTFGALAEAEKFRDDCKAYKDAERARGSFLAQKVAEIDRRLKEIRAKLLAKARKELDEFYKKIASIREAVKQAKESRSVLRKPTEEKKTEKSATSERQIMRKRGRGR